MQFYDWNSMEPAEVNSAYLRKVANGENVTVARVEVNRGSITQVHQHENEEVIVVLEGAWRFQLPGGPVTIGVNQMLMIPPGVAHSSEALEDTIALDICAPGRKDWIDGADQFLHDDPDQSLWAV
ncbi:MAG TPA: cupin domain-containing protein [Pyrinomonadaceae bacterium]|jgi:quercetin dioxygenase-like cupin family protein